MKRRVTFHPEAEGEVDDAAQYYGRVTKQLAEEFLDEVERCAYDILRSPNASVALTQNIRRRLTRRFPYALIYRVLPNEIRILAVAHLKRRPSYWVGRR